MTIYGTISSDSTLNTDTVYVTGNVLVIDGITLAIPAGTVVLGDSNCYFEIKGRLLAIGTSTDSIIFTASDTTKGWGGIYFNNINEATNDSSKVVFSIIEYAKYSSVIGGGVTINGADKVIVSNCRLSDNKAMNGRGGAIFIGGNPIITYNLIYNNHSENGGGIDVTGAPTISNNIIHHNSAHHGGGILTHPGNALISNNLISNNWTWGTHSSGGGIGCFHGGTNKIVNNCIVNNESYHGGGIMSQPGTIINNTICNNKATGWGGGGLYLQASTDCRNNIIFNNEAPNAGAGHQVQINDPSNDPNFQYNNIQGGFASIKGSGSGSNYNGIYQNNIDSTPSFINPSAGAGIAYNGLAADWSIDSSNTELINRGDPDTTGLYLPPTDMAGKLRIHRGRIDIGAYENHQDIIAECIISSNTLWDADTVKVYCNTTINDSVTLTIAPGTHVEFQGQYKIDVRGRILAIGTVNDRISFSINDTTNFNNMDSANGGWHGLFFYNTPNSNDSSRLIFCNFTYAKKCTPVNAFWDRGAALFVYNWSKLLVSNCLFSNNRSQSSGGAISIENSSPVLKNNIICNNTAGQGLVNPSGGGLHLHTSSSQIINNTIVNNYSTNLGSEVHLWQSTATFKNNIIRGNNMSINIAGNLSANPFYNNCIQNGQSGFYGSIYLNNIDFDPIFTSPSAGIGASYDGTNADWSIAAGSPCVNTGHPNSSALGLPSIDNNGYQRIVGDTVDIGAYEVQLSRKFIYGQPADQSVCQNSNASISFNVSIPMTFQWKKNGIDISGATNSTITITSAQPSDTGYYYCVLTNDFGTINTDSAFLTVRLAPAIISQPVSDSACYLDTASFSITVSGSGPMSYQWFNSNGQVSGSNSTYVINSVNPNNVSMYNCVATNSCGTVSSLGAVVVMNSPPVISSIPPSYAICENQNLTYSVNAAGTQPISYQWFYNNSSITGGNTNTFNITSLSTSDVGNYYCKIENMCGIDSSNTSLLTVDSLPEIITQSSSSSTCIGQIKTFNVVATGSSPLSYQWYYSNTPIAGATYNFYTINSVQNSDAGNYFCIVTNSCGNAQSNSATLTVNSPIFISNQSGDSSRCVGESMTFSVQANGTAPITYQWYNANGTIIGATNSSYIINTVTLADAGYYYCVITNSCGSIQSTYKNFTVNALPNVSLGNDTTFCMGGSVVLGPGFGYATLWNNGSYNPQLNVISSGSYWCTVLDQNGCQSISDTVNVNVLQPYATEELCIVGVDSATQKNIVVWEKTINVGTESYNIYKESTVSGVYNLIANRDFDSTAYIIDQSSNPVAKAARYKLSVLDSCGNESPLSAAHKTMHLTINAGIGGAWNLIWDPYEGFPVSTYRIWRADTSLQWVLIDSVQGSLWTYVDVNPPSGGLYYRVEVIKSGGACNPSGNKDNTNFNSSRSNTASSGGIMLSLLVDFSAAPTSGIPPLTVNFTDETANGATYWYWNFGDGYTTTQQSPTHIYDSIGIFHVTLTASNADGSSSYTKYGFINTTNVGISEFTFDNSISVYPNPYSGSTNITYDLDTEADVIIDVYNSIGVKVQQIVEEKQTNGSFTYTFSAKDLGYSAGIYYLKIRINENIYLKKLIEVR